MFRDWLLSPVVSFYSFSSPFDGNSRLNLNPGFRCIALFGTVITAKWPVGTCKPSYRNHLTIVRIFYMGKDTEVPVLCCIRLDYIPRAR